MESITSVKVKAAGGMCYGAGTVTGGSRTFGHIHQLETTVGTVRKLRYFLRRHQN